MVNWNSIVSSFNAKGTLLKWLKQVDGQLEQGQLESVTVADETSTTFCLLFTFADGSTIKTDAITKLAGADGQDGTSIYWHYAIISNVRAKVYDSIDPSTTFRLEFVFPSLSNEAATDLAGIVSKNIWQKYCLGTVIMTKTGDNAGMYYTVAQALLETGYGSQLCATFYKKGAVFTGFVAEPTLAAYDGMLDFEQCSVYDYVAGVE